jgi:hypothetical protein
MKRLPLAMRLSTLLLAAFLLGDCHGHHSSAEAQAEDPSAKPVTAQPPPDATTLDRLRAFKLLVKKAPTADEQILSALTELSKSIPDDRLSTVECFAATDEGSAIAWSLARLLSDRNRLDAAAEVIVSALSADPENRQYRMWKWWEFSFRERADYDQLTRAITESLLKQFERGPKDRRIIICDLFGRDHTDAQLMSVISEKNSSRQPLARKPVAAGKIMDGKFLLMPLRQTVD